MERQRVSSTNVQSIGYDPSTGTLEVEFHSGELYEYLDYHSYEDKLDELFEAEASDESSN